MAEVWMRVKRGPDLLLPRAGRAVRGPRDPTIEGVAHGDRAHPLQSAFIKHDGFQCGYCTSGQICSAIGMLAEHAAGAPSAVTDSPPWAHDRHGACAGLS